MYSIDTIDFLAPQTRKYPILLYNCPSQMFATKSERW